MEKQGLHRIKRYKNRWLITYIGEAILLSGAFFCCVLILSVFMFPSQGRLLGFASLVISFPAFFFLRGYEKISIVNVLRLLNIENPELQYSADLLVRDKSTLTKLEQLQKGHIHTLLATSDIKFAIPNKMKMILSIMFLCFVAYVLSFYIKDEIIKVSKTEITPWVTKEVTTSLTSNEVGVKSLEVTITPPTYTLQKERIQSTLDLVVAEGSLIEWEFDFYEKVKKVVIKFSDKSELVLKKEGQSYFGKIQTTSRMLYELYYVNQDDSTVYSDFHKIDIIYDTPPKVEIGGLAQFTEYEYNSDKKISINAKLSDDYGLTDAYVIATIAQGTGESVLFREEKILLDEKIKKGVKNANLSKHLDLETFGMQPGDELYFYLEAQDNCTLKRNVTRTETYIISIRDTSTFVSTMEGGLGVDLMPEYFRSQRQIIIDTEKLLKNKQGLSAQDFNGQSNELGFDQKVLRLKYGQFLGEEDDSGIAIENPKEVAHNSEENGEEVDVLEGYTHDHDSEDEHEKANEGETKDPLDNYKHAHDSEEEATFFTNSIKGKLKAAMSLMWDAELYLRLYQPEKSLPYQYKALKLIKEIKNHGRVYVHRIGFDPPPIKEESRLSADLSEVKDHRLNKYDTVRNNPAIRKVITLINQQIHAVEGSVLEPGVLQAAGVELSQIALENPGKYLYGLQLLRDLMNGKELKVRSLNFLQNQLIQALPEEGLNSEQQGRVLDPLSKKYLQVLEEKKIANDRR